LQKVQVLKLIFKALFLAASYPTLLFAKNSHHFRIEPFSMFGACAKESFAKIVNKSM
jgi:hypothetical protein